jgi:hypothetical protein
VNREVAEMQGTEGFLELAGIAGVFVGFGALIAVRSGGASDAFEVVHMRFVVWLGMLTVVAALAPVTLGPYGLGEHLVWVLSSVIVVAVYFGMGIVNVRMPELKAGAVSDRRRQVREAAFSFVLAVPVAVAVIVILLGLRPDLDAALYRTILVLLLVGAGGTMLELVYSQRSRASA